MNAAQNVSKA